MPNQFIFVDEAGCMAFSRQPNVSRYFILCSVIMDNCAIASELLDLRRSLVLAGSHELKDYFHAAEDKQSVRNAVFDLLGRHEFTVQATVMEKPKATPNLRTAEAGFYGHGFYCHFKYGVNHVLDSKAPCNALVTTASLGTNKQRATFKSAIDAALRRNPSRNWYTDFRASQSDPCLQVADYCAWAIQRKWERGDSRSYDLVSEKIVYEHDLWRSSTVEHY
ncbi:MAG: DUF3800 domain-containing protein [Pseudomonadota bacterium]